MRLNLQLFKGGVKSGSSAETVDQTAAHFASENARVEQLLAGRGFETMTMENGQILERYSMEQLWKDTVMEYKRNGYIPEDDALLFIYSDGHYEYYVGGDDFTRGMAPKKGLIGIGWSNAMTDGFAGHGLTFVNYRELYGESWGDDDWRLEAASDHPGHFHS